MKRALGLKGIALAGFGLLLAGLPARADVVLDLVEPENYSDFKLDAFRDKPPTESFVREAQRSLDAVAERHLPPGATLHLKIRDIDMAGEFEPWLRAPYDDVRIVRSVYPPRVEFDYSVVDANGNELASGSETLVELGFDYDLGRRFHRHDDFYSEKDVISSWIRNDLSRKLKANG